MSKDIHEICDPIHTFIKFNSEERKVINSLPLQRLRHIHQLGLTYLVYPGVTHKRFEHSLGVMDLATKVFDIITDPSNIHRKIKQLAPPFSKNKRKYWRLVLRMAALCHDIGHLPFSHTAEKDFLPNGYSHETLTKQIIESNFMARFWRKMEIKKSDIVKLALGKEKLKNGRFSIWEALLSEIIVSDTFGVDRMDYLLRDSHYAGVSYGKFDYFRLIETLRVLPEEEGSDIPKLGIEIGGLAAAESLLLARHFMRSKLYYHHVRRIYDIHLKEFMKTIFPTGFSIDTESFLKLTDNELFVMLFKASRRRNKKALILTEREHFKLLYSRNYFDININPDALHLIHKALRKKYGKEYVRIDAKEREPEKKESKDKESIVTSFPVLRKDGRIYNGFSLSNIINKIEPLNIEYIFISRDIFEKARAWLDVNRNKILSGK